MALIRPNDRALQDITTLPTAVSSDFLASDVDVGKVVQVVNGSATNHSIFGSSTTYMQSGDTVTITPQSSSSKILVVFNTSAHLNTASTSGGVQRGYYTIFRGSTDIGSGNGDGVIMIRKYGNGATNHYAEFPMSIQVVDTPNTTSAITYEARFKSEGGEEIGYSYDGFIRTFYAMEIAG